MIDRSRRHVNINWIVERSKIQHENWENEAQSVWYRARQTHTRAWWICYPLRMNEWILEASLYRKQRSAILTFTNRMPFLLTAGAVMRGEFPLKNEFTALIRQREFRCVDTQWVTWSMNMRMKGGNAKSTIKPFSIVSHPALTLDVLREITKYPVTMETNPFHSVFMHAL